MFGVAVVIALAGLYIAIMIGAVIVVVAVYAGYVLLAILLNVSAFVFVLLKDGIKNIAYKKERPIQTLAYLVSGGIAAQFIGLFIVSIPKIAIGWGIAVMAIGATVAMTSLIAILEVES